MIHLGQKNLPRDLPHIHVYHKHVSGESMKLLCVSQVQQKLTKKDTLQQNCKTLLAPLISSTLLHDTQYRNKSISLTLGHVGLQTKRHTLHLSVVRINVDSTQITPCCGPEIAFNCVCFSV